MLTMIISFIFRLNGADCDTVISNTAPSLTATELGWDPRQQGGGTIYRTPGACPRFCWYQVCRPIMLELPQILESESAECPCWSLNVKTNTNKIINYRCSSVFTP